MAKQKLTERIIVSPDEYKKVPMENLSESQQNIKVTESTGNTEPGEYKAKAIYTFPISRPGQPNLNERVYPTNLWEKVIGEKQGEGAFGLMDHPEGEGSAKDIWCVWRNLRFSEEKDLVLADAYLFGKWGEMVKEALEAGGNIGLSTSGFGEMDRDGVTVKPESYELERPSDFVLNPSYQVFGSQENAAETEETKSVGPEQKQEETNVEQTREETMPKDNVDRMKKFEEKSFRLNMNSQVKNIDSREDLSFSEKVKSYKELLEFFEEGVAEDLREEIENKIEKTQEKIEELAQQGASLGEKIQESSQPLQEKIDALQEENLELQERLEAEKEKFRKSTELLDSLKVYSNKMKEMYDVSEAEKNGMISAEEYTETLSYIESLEEKVETLSKKNRKLANRVRSLGEKVAESEQAFEESAEEKEEIEETYGPDVNPQVAAYFEDLLEANPSVEKLREDILSQRTIIEAQRTYMRLKGLLSTGDYHYTERKVRRPKNTFVEADSGNLKIRKGWV